MTTVAASTITTKETTVSSSGHPLIVHQNIGDSFQGTYYVEAQYVKLTTQNKKYTDMMLRDKSGARNVKFWGTVDNLESGEFVRVTARVEDYQGNASIIASKVEKVAEPSDLSDFIPTFDNLKETQDMLAELIGEVVKMEGSQNQETCRMLLGEIFNVNEAFYGRFVESPGSEFPHYGRSGGLMVATVNVAKAALALSERYGFGDMEKSILITAALLHRIGAADAFAFEHCMPKCSKKGILIGTGYLTFNRLSAAIRKVVADAKKNNKTISQDVILRILHAVSSHDETMVKPMAKEALILAAAFRSDAEMVETFDFMANDLNVNDEFTAYDVRRGRRYLRG